MSKQLTNSELKLIVVNSIIDRRIKAILELPSTYEYLSSQSQEWGMGYSVCYESLLGTIKDILRGEHDDILV